MSTYVLHPGRVKSRNDMDIHFISAGQLRDLYRIPRDARVLVDEGQPGFRAPADAIHCRPRYDGNYPVFS